MSERKILKVCSVIEHCGECAYAELHTCELTGTKIVEWWKGIQPDCPLEDYDETDTSE